MDKVYLLHAIERKDKQLAEAVELLEGSMCGDVSYDEWYGWMNCRGCGRKGTWCGKRGDLLARVEESCE